MTITSFDDINENHLRLNVHSSKQACGSIDFISEKINFYITGQSFFKGMVIIKDIKLEYIEEKLVFTFLNKKKLTFNCSVEDFEKVNIYIKKHTEFINK